MFINPVLRLPPPSPPRRIWRRLVESVAAVAPPSPVAAGDHQLASTASAVEASARQAEAAELGPVYESPILTDATLAGLNALRAADAEVAARALLAGAKAHGPIDLARLKLILRHLEEIGATAADRDYVLAHLRDKTDMQDLVNAAHDRTTAQETYYLAASMVDPGAPSEAAWLAELRGRLRERATRFV